MEFLNIQKEGQPYKQELLKLYEEAFPPEEKKPFSLMERLAQEGKMELLAVVQDGQFAGLVLLMLSADTALLDYFAIVEKYRCTGLGGQALRQVIERLKNKKFIFEIEMQDEAAPNANERRRRKNFYMRNGLRETGVFARVYDTDFELITPDGALTFEEYVAFLHEILGEEGVKLLRPEKLERECDGR